MRPRGARGLAWFSIAINRLGPGRIAVTSGHHESVTLRSANSFCRNSGVCYAVRDFLPSQPLADCRLKVGLAGEAWYSAAVIVANAGPSVLRVRIPTYWWSSVPSSFPPTQLGARNT
jgi:hypothetical protein